MQFDFNSDQHEAQDTGFSLIPTGWQPMMVIESEVKDINNGKMVVLKTQIIDGEFKNRTLYTRLCVVHTNATCQKIANSTLKGISEAMGIPVFTDTNQLHNKPFMGKVKIDKGSGGYDDSNSISAGKAFDQSSPVGSGITITDNLESISKDDLPEFLK